MIWDLGQVRTHLDGLGLTWPHSPPLSSAPAQPYVPTVPAEREHLALASLCRGERLQARQQFQEAEQACNEARETFARLAAESPDTPRYQRHLARSQLSLAYLFHRTRCNALAEKAGREAEAVSAKLAEHFAGDPDSRMSLAETRGLLAEVLCALGHLPDAERAYRGAEEGYARLAADFSRQPGYRDLRGWSANRLGEFLQANGRLAEAEQSYRSALAVYERLVEEFPRVVGFREKGTAVRLNLAGVHAATGALPRPWPAAGRRPRARGSPRAFCTRQLAFAPEPLLRSGATRSWPRASGPSRRRITQPRPWPCCGERLPQDFGTPTTSEVIPLSPPCATAGSSRNCSVRSRRRGRASGPDSSFEKKSSPPRRDLPFGCNQSEGETRAIPGWTRGTNVRSACRDQERGEGYEQSVRFFVQGEGVSPRGEVRQSAEPIRCPPRRQVEHWRLDHAREQRGRFAGGISSRVYRGGLRFGGYGGRSGVPRRPLGPPRFRRRPGGRRAVFGRPQGPHSEPDQLRLPDPRPDCRGSPGADPVPFRAAR